jgi:hypothetical protein
MALPIQAANTGGHMEISITQAIEAQPLDDDGDPAGEVVTLTPGSYELRSISREDDGSTLAWLVDDAGKLYEARVLRMGS